MRRYLVHFILIGTTSLFLTEKAGFSADLPSGKHKYGLLTSGYGIVTEDDLAYDESERKITEYDSKDPLGSLHWQCLPTYRVSARYESWRGPDGMGAWNEIHTMCTIELGIRHPEDLEIYVDRRGHRIGFCREFIHEWKRITKGESIVCLNGDGGGYHQEENGKKVKLWTWEKFKTRRGCYSYFADTCRTKGSATR